MNANRPALRDIHLPPVSWWPPAPGWWVLTALIVLLIAASIWWVLRRHKHAMPRRAAQRELDALAARHARDHDDAALLARVSRLLRRIALLLEPAVAARDGAAWRAFLQTRGQDAFDHTQLDALVDAPYRARIAIDAQQLLAAARRWCECALKRRGARDAKPSARIITSAGTQTGSLS